MELMSLHAPGNVWARKSGLVRELWDSFGWNTTMPLYGTSSDLVKGTKCETLAFVQVKKLNSNLPSPQTKSNFWVPLGTLKQE